MSRPSEELRDEDEYLELLDKDKKEKYACVCYESWNL
jgi:hypothetical protein